MSGKTDKASILGQTAIKRDIEMDERKHAACQLETCDDCFEDGINSVLNIRCMAHRAVAQLNKSEANQGECGACAFKSGFKDALEWVKTLRDEKVSIDTIIKGLELRLIALFLPRKRK